MKKPSIALAISALLTTASGHAAGMTANQESAFRGANTGNSAFTEVESSFLIAGTASVLVLTWFAWIVFSSYKAWGRQRMSGDEAGGQVLRALLVTLVTLVIVAY